MTEDTATQPTAPTDAGGQPADAANQPTTDTLPTPKKASPRRKVAARRSVPAEPILTDNGEEAAVAKVVKPRVRKTAAPKTTKAKGKEAAPEETTVAAPANEPVKAPEAAAPSAKASPSATFTPFPETSGDRSPTPAREPQAPAEEKPARDLRAEVPDASIVSAAKAAETVIPPATPKLSAPVLPAAPERSPAEPAEAPAGLVAPSPSVEAKAAEPAPAVAPGASQNGPVNRDNFQSPDRPNQPFRQDDQSGQPGRFNRRDRHGRQDRRDRFSQGGGQGGNPQGGQPGGQRDFQGPGQRDPQGQGQGQRDFQGQGQRDSQGQRDGREPRDFQGQGGRDGRNNDGQPQGGQPGGGDGFVSRVVEPTFGEGIVEVSGKGFGFLREAKRNFVQTPADIFVTPEVCRKYNLRDGQWIKGEVRRSSRGPQLFRLLELNGEDPEKFKNLPNFEELTTINPKKRIRLETTPDRYTTRVMDLMTPVGKGQRGLIVAPPRTGKTTLLQHIAEAVVKNHPEMKLIILLVDERPEEVTEIRRGVPQAEIMASSNDSDLKSHTRIAQLAMERCKRLVEAGFDVFMLLDSITRMGRAFNNAATGGRTMSGGVDSRALEIPRKIFAAARNTEEAGSLTIMATALIETGSRMDDVIFLEFKGTGNMELVLDRKISDQRIYPAVDIFQSGTRREELLLQAWELDKINVIRRGLAGHKPLEAIERLLSFLKKFPTNAQMLTSLPG